MAHPQIDLIKYPPKEVVGAYNCVEFCYLINDNVTNDGENSNLTIQFQSAVASGKTMDIFGQQFLFSNIGNENGKTIALGSDETDQRDKAYATFLTNYELSKNFNIIVNGTDQIILVAKEKSPDFNTNFSTTSANIQEVSSQSGADETVRDAYKVVACIQIKENQTWVVKDEVIRDVARIRNDEGFLGDIVCFKIQSFLREYYKHNKPDLNNTNAYINIGGAFEFKLAIVDFKSTTGQTVNSGYFDNDVQVYCAINGMHKLTEKEIGMCPYYQKFTDGFVLPLNQIPYANYLCCDNNGYMAIFVRDKDSKGWAVEMIGNVHFKDGSIESNYSYGGFSGVGTAVVVIPIGPRQIGICNNFLDKGDVEKYTYQGFIFNNDIATNLFVDGDNGTFEDNINNIWSLPGLSQSQGVGYIGAGLLLDDWGAATFPGPGLFAFFMGQTQINFLKGNTYILEAWVKVENVDCVCVGNRFVDAEYGTFEDSQADTTIISGASSDVVAQGFEGDGLLIYDLDGASISQGDYLIFGDTAIDLIGGDCYELSAWVKVGGVDCDTCILSLFVDGDVGTFDGPSPLAGIEALAGITKGIASGNNGDGLSLTTLQLASISDGSVLFYGDTDIQFVAGETYNVSMFINLTGYDCGCASNIFVDGNYGTFEFDGVPLGGILTQIAGAVLGIDFGYQNTQGLLIEKLANLSDGQFIFYGDTLISFSAGKTYTMSMRVRLDDICSCAATTTANLFTSGDNGTFENPSTATSTMESEWNANFVLNQGPGMASPASLHVILENGVMFNTEYLAYGLNSVSPQIGKTYEAICWVKADAFSWGDIATTNHFVDGGNGTFDNPGDIASISTDGANPGGFITHNNTYQYALINSDYTGPVFGTFQMYGNTAMSLTQTQIYRCVARIYVESFGVSGCGCPPSKTANIRVNIYDGFSDASNVTFVRQYNTVKDCEGQWITLETTFTCGADVNGRIGIEVAGADSGDCDQVVFRVDNIAVFQQNDQPNKVRLELQPFDPTNLTVIVDEAIEWGYEQKEKWIRLKTTFTCTGTSTTEFGVRVIANADKIKANSDVFIDNFTIIEKGENITMGIDFVNPFNPADVTGDTITNVEYNSASCSSLEGQWALVEREFTVVNSFNNKIGLKLIEGDLCLADDDQQVRVDEVIVNDGSVSYLTLHAGLKDGIGFNGTETISQDVVFQGSCGNLGTWIELKTVIQATNDFLGKIGLIATGNADCLEDIAVELRADDILVEASGGNKAKLRMNIFGTLNSAVVSFDKELELSGDCDNLGEWTLLKTTIDIPIMSSSIQAGLQIANFANCFGTEDVEVMIDSIKLVSKTKQNIGIKIYPQGEVPNFLTSLVIDGDCEKLGEWHKITSSFTPLVDTLTELSIGAENMSSCLTEDPVSVFIDEVKVLCYNDITACLTPEYTTNLVNTSDKNCCDDCCNEEFAYLNELGEFDFIHFECLLEKTQIISKVEIGTCRDCDGDISTEGDKTVSAESRDRFLINARIRKEKKEQFDIFARSIEAYHVVNGKYYPVKLLNSEVSAFRRTNVFVDVDLEFEYTFENPTLTL